MYPRQGKTVYRRVSRQTLRVFFDAPTPDDTPPQCPDPSPCEPVKFMDFKVCEDFATHDFLENVKLTRVGARQVAHFGAVDYDYGGVKHPACPYPQNTAIDAAIEQISNNLKDPDFSKHTYCCLITLYDNGRDFIPYHTDNEPSILSGSDIYTVSIGQTRSISFRNIIGRVDHNSPPLTYPLEHGSVHVMTQLSQSEFEHTVPRCTAPDIAPLISLTFRRLVQVPHVPIPPIARPSLPPPPPPRVEERTKRVLLLTDSINSRFPVEIFPESYICIKKLSYKLLDLPLFESEFAYTDYVFISMGINELSRYGYNAKSLSAHACHMLDNFRKKYPNTSFIFNSLLLTGYDWLNREVEQFNNDMFLYTLNPDCSVWFFDSHHVAMNEWSRGARILQAGPGSNGIHITFAARKAISNAIRTNILNLGGGIV